MPLEWWDPSVHPHSGPTLTGQQALLFLVLLAVCKQPCLFVPHLICTVSFFQVRGGRFWSAWPYTLEAPCFE